MIQGTLCWLVSLGDAKGGGAVFGLPTFTTAVIVGVPAFWVLYTLGFMWISRGWKAEDVEVDHEN